MTARAETLANAITEAMPLFERFLVGFDDSNRTTQAPMLPNHAAWTLGHLALVATRGAERVAGHTAEQPLPVDEFGDAGPTRFDPESVAIGSVPADEPAAYPGWDRCVEIYRAAHARLIESVRDAGDDVLDAPVPWGSNELSAQALIVRMIVHLGTHTGQIVDLRRALGHEPLIK